MGRVVDRLFGYIVLGIFGLLLAQIVLGLIERLLARILGSFTGSFFGSVVLLVLTLLLVAGLGVRVARVLTSPRGRTGRDSIAEMRQTRQSARRPAQEVPVEDERVLPEDRDPVISYEEV